MSSQETFLTIRLIDHMFQLSWRLYSPRMTTVLYTWFTVAVVEVFTVIQSWLSFCSRFPVNRRQRYVNKMRNARRCTTSLTRLWLWQSLCRQVILAQVWPFVEKQLAGYGYGYGYVHFLFGFVPRLRFLRIEKNFIKSKILSISG